MIVDSKIKTLKEELLNSDIDLLLESPASEKHESDIAAAFKGKSLPESLPKWMILLGIIPGAKVVSTEKVGQGGSKTDVVIKFDKGEPLKISAKMSNADYFGNWYTKAKEEISAQIVPMIADATLAFALKYTPKMEGTFVGVSVSFGKRSGQTGKKFSELFDISLIKNVVAGNNPNGARNANCLYTTTTVPKDINKLLANIKPVSDSVVKELSQNFFLIFRPVFTATNKTNMSKQAWAKLRPIKKLKKPTLFKTQKELLRVTEWVATGRDETITHNTVVSELKKNNIYVIQSGKDLPKSLEGQK